MYRVPLLPSAYKPVKFEKIRIRNNGDIDSGRKWERKNKKPFYTNYRVIFLCPYIELSFFAHKWNHCSQILIWLLVTLTFDLRTWKSIQLLLLSLSIYLPSLKEIGWKTKEISRFIVSGKERKIIKIIIRNRTKIGRSTDFVGWP